MPDATSEADLIAQLETCEVSYGPEFADGGRFFHVSRWVGLSGGPRGFYDLEEFATEEQARERFDALTRGDDDG